MEILFIWLQNYKNLKEQGFNFSSEFIFEIKKIAEDTYKLDISKNKSFIPDFFEKENILNVTAIVGQNGSGKSNILDFIKENLVEGYSSNSPQAIIIYRYRKNIQKKFILIPKDGFKVDIENNEDFIILGYPLDNSASYPEIHEFEYFRADYIFYSNIFDLKLEETGIQGLHNLSTNGMLQFEANSNISNLPVYITDSFSKYKDNEIRRNLEFVISDYSKLLDEFPLPEILFIEINTHWSNSNNKELFEGLNQIYFNYSKMNGSLEDFFITGMYISVLRILLIDYNNNPIVQPFNVSNYNNEGIKSYIINTIDKLGKTPTIYSTQEFRTKLDKALTFLRLVEELINLNLLVVDSNYSNRKLIAKYYIRKNNINKINKLFDLYMSIKGFNDFLDFKWRNLSSGEQSLFTFLSRFYHLKHHDFISKDLKKNLVILIDEGDIYFHPQWQKSFFKISIDYLCELFKNHKIQFIFTSNTPFITSDLPKSNIIFIEKESNEKVIVHGLNNDKEETFGGNIHTLFADSFYMKGAVMGEFAKNKINMIIGYLKNPSSEKNDLLKKTIEIIGEPVLKRKLLEMWFDKFGVQEEIEILQKRIDQLKNKGK